MGKSDSDKVVRITEEAFANLKKFGANESNLKKVVSEIILDYTNLLNSLEREKREAYNLGFNKGFSAGYNKKTEDLREKEKAKKRLTKIFGKKGDFWYPWRS